MKRLASLTSLILAGIVLTIALGGCPQDGTNANLATDELTSGEKDALSAGVQAGQSLGEAATVAKSSAEDDDSSFNIPEFPIGSQEYSFGTCPEVTMSLVSNSLLTFNMSLDFGTTGCTPYYTAETYTCSGSATGTFDQQNQNVNLTFNDVSCNDASLTGDIDVNYSISGQTITLQGDWDLDYEDDIGPVQTNGEGTGSYDADNYITTFSIFNGTITDTVTSWTMGINNVKMSYPTYGNYIPYSGETTVSGSDIRTIKVTFDANSPSTGKVQVSIGGAPAFEVDLYAL